MFFVKYNIILSLKQIFKNSLKRSKTIFKTVENIVSIKLLISY